MSRTRFRYALEPVLLTRRWALDALLQALSQRNADIAEHAARQAATQARYEGACTDWKTMANADHEQSVLAFAISGRYLADLTRQLREQAVHMAELVSARDEVILQVMDSQRSFEAVEHHRAKAKQEFVRQCASADLKAADDQWNTLQAGEIISDHST